MLNCIVPLRLREASAEQGGKAFGNAWPSIKKQKTTG